MPQPWHQLQHQLLSPENLINISLQHLTAFLLNKCEFSHHHYAISQGACEAEDGEGQTYWKHPDGLYSWPEIPSISLSVNFADCRAFLCPKYTVQGWLCFLWGPRKFCNTSLKLGIQGQLGFETVAWDYTTVAAEWQLHSIFRNIKTRSSNSALPIVKTD